ncbi:heavy metal translocating P-type ATPase [Culicoidibacter larvae]|uniref:P-type Cu(+) transporter n=1 Tax=Culicoidibacter larvae TaxID=2579976 RepID=A0A5R8QDV3_9FIRM|nr:heavy metal translocating P-type ATPase [Culicoidibacter larvae]TLG74183.1 copper-translocating P-type ATPase [Culicoidibacter larvae]
MMKNLKMRVNGMTCTNCSATIERVLAKQEGVEAVVNFSTGYVVGKYDDSKYSLEDIAAMIERAGYDPVLPEKEAATDTHKHGTKEMKRDLWIGIITSLILNIPMIEHLGIAHVPEIFNNPLLQFILATIAMYFVGRNFFISAIKGIRHGNLNMDVLVTIGAISAYGYSIFQWVYYAMNPGAGMPFYYFETAAVILTLIFIGHYIEGRATEKTTTALKDLEKLAATEAHVLVDGAEVTIPIDQIRVNTEMRVYKGEKIPVDGIVVTGDSFIDEAVITGESVPVMKEKGSDVIGGTINMGDTLVIRATKVGGDTMLSAIIQVVEEAQMKKPSIQRIADKISTIFVPTILVIALVTFIGWMVFSGDFIQAFNAAMSVVVISCPCALGLATPLSVLVGTSNAAKMGILYKAGDVFERIQKVDAICFDKTGTLTVGKPQVLTWLGDTDVFDIVWTLEREVVHPIAYAMVEYTAAQDAKAITFDNFKEVAGYGIEGSIGDEQYLIGSLKYMNKENKTIAPKFVELQEASLEKGHTLVYIAKNDAVVAMAAVSDEIKPNAKATIEKMKKRGITTYMITGDNEKAAHTVAIELGIDHVYAGVLPTEKADYIKKIQAEGKQVAFVGDGVNDAPALVVADLGIALGSGTDVAISAADVTLVNSDLDSVDKALQLSQATLRNIYENFAWAFSYNLIAIPMAAFGLLNPMWAAAFMAFSDIVVVLNAWRLRFFKTK